MVERRVQRIRRGLTGWKEKVLGSSGFERQSRFGPTYFHSVPQWVTAESAKQSVADVASQADAAPITAFFAADWELEVGQGDR